MHLVKQPRYYSAVDEIREPLAEKSLSHRGGGQSWGNASNPDNNWRDPKVRRPDPRGALPGSVWTVPTEPLRVPDRLGVDHFAAFPTEWPRRLILGWSPPGICMACGEGRRPVAPQEKYAAAVKAAREAAGLTRAELAERAGCGSNNVWDYEEGGHLPRGQAWADLAAALNLGLSRHEFIATAEYVTTGSQDSELRRSAVQQGAARPYVSRKIALRQTQPKTCACPQPNAPTRPAVVLDPFGGTGTTALVASTLGRIGVSVDLSADYCRLARWRTTDPAERARAMRVDKPPVQVDGQLSLLDGAL